MFAVMWKPLLLLCLLARAAAAQTTLPLDSVSGKVTYTGVVQVPGASAAELYSRGREWFAYTFGSSKTVLEMDDHEAGKLIGRAYAQFDFAAGIGRPQPWALWRKIKVEVKEGKYRYTISDFVLGGPISQPDASTHPLESWLAPTIARGKRPGNMVLSVIAGADVTGKQEAASLQAAMGKKPGGDF